MYFTIITYKLLRITETHYNYVKTTEIHRNTLHTSRDAVRHPHFHQPAVGPTALVGRVCRWGVMVLRVLPEENLFHQPSKKNTHKLNIIIYRNAPCFFNSSMFSTRTCININAPFMYFFDVFDMKSIPCKWQTGDAELCTALPVTYFSQRHHPRPPSFAILPRRHLEESMTWLSLRNLSSAYN